MRLSLRARAPMTRAHSARATHAGHAAEFEDGKRKMQDLSRQNERLRSERYASTLCHPPDDLCFVSRIAVRSCP